MRRVKNPLMTCLPLALGLCLGDPAAADVYRWTDAAGQVHYSERPPPQGPALRLDLPATGSPPAGGDAHAAERRARQQRLLEAFEYERAQQAERAARAAKQRLADAERCRALRQRWGRLSHPGPIYVGRPDGGRDYLDAAQREAEKAGMRPAYRQACGQEP